MPNDVGKKWRIFHQGLENGAIHLLDLHLEVSLHKLIIINAELISCYNYCEP